MPVKISTFIAGGLAGAAATTAVSWYYNRLYYSRQLHSNLEIFTELLCTQQQLANKTYFIIDRILDADCKGKPLTIGVHTNRLSTTPYGNQGIRHGEPGAPIRRLLSFQRNGPDRLDYGFENETSLSVIKQPDGSLLYTFQDPSVSVSKRMDPMLVKYLKGIDMNSQELDAIVQMR